MLMVAPSFGRFVIGLAGVFESSSILKSLIVDHFLVRIELSSVIGETSPLIVDYPGGGDRHEDDQQEDRPELRSGEAAEEWPSRFAKILEAAIAGGERTSRQGMTASVAGRRKAYRA